MTRTSIPLLALVLLVTGCVTPWQPLHEGDGWTLYVQDGQEIEPAAYRTAFEAGLACVEDVFGPLENHVRVFAWDGGVRMNDGTRGSIENGEVVQIVPGIGPAKVQAFHARGSDIFGGRSGVFLGQADVGTAVHELVHARLAERPETLPLWFEEGVAMVLGDGILHNGKWVCDGLACWPLRELGEERLTDEQLGILLSLRPGDAHDLRTNVLVHFLGWAIVFDLFRQEGSLEWEKWSNIYQDGISVAEARRRMESTLSSSTPLAWLERLDDPDPAVRLAAVKGTWKLRSRDVATRLVSALRSEDDPEVKAALAINLLTTSAETSLGRRTWWRMWRYVGPVLREPDLPDPKERAALRTLYRYYRYEEGERESKEALQDLGRFLDE